MSAGERDSQPLLENGSLTLGTLIAGIADAIQKQYILNKQMHTYCTQCTF